MPKGNFSPYPNLTIKERHKIAFHKWYERHGKEYFANWRISHRKECIETTAKYRQNNPKKWKFIKKQSDRKHHLKYRYGLTQEQFDEMIELQGNKCKICCRKFTDTPCIDHNHKTWRNKRLLCDRCNTLIGRAEEDVELLENAIKYLKRSVKVFPLQSELSR